MKNLKVLFFFLPLICISFMGCEDEPAPAIDEDLLIYVENFIFEANEREYVNANGNPLHIDSLDIEIQFANIANPAVIGRCNRQDHVISIDPIYWKPADELVKEYIMFHELGHCVLGRDHNTAADITNTCLSIMEPGTGEACTSNYTESTRAKLLDELFDF